jgi:indole-3-glycerol phosphate synthase
LFVQDSVVDTVATSTHATDAEAVGTTEQGGNGSPAADAASTGAPAEVASVDGIRIRRHPVTGPPVHYVGPFQFRLKNEGNMPQNILEKIVWDKDVEVSQARSVR